MTTFRESPEFASRDGFARILNLRYPEGFGCEIGTWRGGFAERVLSEWTCRWFHCVDPWAGRCLPHDESVRDFDLQWTIARLRPYCERVRLWRMVSSEAVKLVPDPLNFIYIDGDHSYEGCDTDLHLWWPRLAAGGILAGHDFSPGGFPGVVRAVKEFAARENIGTVYLGHQVEYRDWLVYKAEGVKTYNWWSSNEVRV